jgi:hypothetical protein
MVLHMLFVVVICVFLHHASLLGCLSVMVRFPWNDPIPFHIHITLGAVGEIRGGGQMARSLEGNIPLSQSGWFS